MKISEAVFLVLVLLPFSALTVQCKKHVSGLPSCDFPALYNFGDSNSDTGGMAAAFFPEGPPCGETYFGRPVGRGSDGRLIVDFFAEHLGMPFLSPYLDSIGTSFKHGANFATGGATIQRINESWFLNGVSPFPLDVQVEHYNQFKNRKPYFYSRAMVESDRNRLPRPQDFSKALYTFDIGQNDLAATLRTKMSQKQIFASIPGIIKPFAAQIMSMYDKGARSFWIHNTGPMGCMPAATLKVENPPPGYLDKHGCVSFQNDIAKKFNKKLKHSVIKLRLKLPEAAITYVDMYKAKYELISNAKKHGFEDPFTVCCGFHGIDYGVWCGNKGTVNGTELFAGSCKKPFEVISWDAVHYTDAANQWLASHLINGSLSDPPVPITQACHRKI